MTRNEFFAATPARPLPAVEAPRPARAPTLREAAQRRDAAARRAREQMCREGWHLELARALVGELDRRSQRGVALR